MQEERRWRCQKFRSPLLLIPTYRFCSSARWSWTTWFYPLHPKHLFYSKSSHIKVIARETSSIRCRYFGQHRCAFTAASAADVGCCCRWHHLPSQCVPPTPTLTTAGTSAPGEDSSSTDALLQEMRQFNLLQSSNWSVYTAISSTIYIIFHTYNMLLDGESYPLCLLLAGCTIGSY